MILTREWQLASLADLGNSFAALKRPIFIVSYGAGHAAALAPVAANLVLAGHQVVCVGLTTAPAVFARFGIESLGVRDLIGFSRNYRFAHRLGRRLMATADRHSQVDQLETDAYMGVGFLALVRGRGLRDARVAFSNRGRQSFCPTEFFEEIFSVLAPSVVVATSAPRSERAAIEAARALGIKRVCLVDLYAPFEVEWCASNDYADMICVLSEAVRAHMQVNGVAGYKVKVTGNPSFDRLKKLDKTKLRNRFRVVRAIPENALVVAWISQEEPRKHPFCDLVGDPQLPAQIENALAAYFLQRADVWVIIRMHPSEKRERQRLGAHVIYSDISESLDELLCGVDVVLTSGSTVGIEAAMLDTPVAQYTKSIFSASLPLAAMGLAVPIDALFDLGPKVEELFSLKQSANPIVQSLRQNVGSAAENVAREIEIIYVNSGK